MRDVHVIEIINRMINKVNYSKVVTRYYNLKDNLTNIDK